VNVCVSIVNFAGVGYAISKCLSASAMCYMCVNCCGYDSVRNWGKASCGEGVGERGKNKNLWVVI